MWREYINRKGIFVDMTFELKLNEVREKAMGQYRKWQGPCKDCMLQEEFKGSYNCHGYAINWQISKA